MDAAATFQKHCAQERDDDSLHLPGWRLDDWRRLLSHAVPLGVPAGEVAIRRGDRERALYFVARGALEVTASTSRSDTLGALSRVHPGSVIGEISLFDGLPRTASVWAIEPTELLRLDIDGLRIFASDNPERAHELLFALGRVLAFRLRRREARAQHAA
jgi:CRP/FNR family transcriptional regulator, cyclic AMP receptor protein